MLYQVDARRRLQEMKCDEGEDVKAHLTEMSKLREELAGMGTAIADNDFAAVIIGSLPSSFRPLLSSLTAVSSLSKATLNPNELIRYILEEYEHRLIQERANKGDAAMMSKSGGKAKGKGKKPKSDVTCANPKCGRKGHTDKECWRPGGGAEGQGPNQKKKKGKENDKTSNSPSANAVDATASEDFSFCTSALEDIAASIPDVPASR